MHQKLTSSNARAVRAVLLMVILIGGAVQNARAQRPELPSSLPASVASSVKSYFDIRSAVKDLSCDVRVTPSGSIQGRFYFKAPDKVKFVSATGTAYDIGVQLLMERDLFPPLAFPFFFALIPPVEWTESKDAAGVKTQGKLIAGGRELGSVTIEASAAGAIRLQITENPLTAAAKPQNMEMKFSNQDRDGNRLLTGITARMADENLKWDWEYMKVGDAFLVSKAVSIGETGQTRTTTCINYKVDQGLDDALF